MIMVASLEIFAVIAGLSVSANAFEFNQSNAFFEERCKAGFDEGIGCAIIGERYEDGLYYEFTTTNIETKVKKDLKKARNYYKMACEQGNKKYCKDYERLSK